MTKTQLSLKRAVMISELSIEFAHMYFRNIIVDRVYMCDFQECDDKVFDIEIRLKPTPLF